MGRSSSQVHGQAIRGEDSAGNFVGTITPLNPKAVGNAEDTRLQFTGLFPIGLSTDYEIVIHGTHSTDLGVTLTYTPAGAGNTTHASPVVWDAVGAAADFAANVVIAGNTSADITATHVTGSGIVTTDVAAGQTFTIDDVRYTWGADTGSNVQQGPFHRRFTEI